jgi:menaquinone-dependent protoporphyrinogen oxidase
MTAARPGRERATVTPLPSRTEPADAQEVIVQSNVLVAYASAHASTRGIAERIAGRLGDRGARVEARSVDEVEGIDAYDMVIVGSAVYSQRWLPNATAFLQRHADALAARTVWLFSVGSFGDTHRVIGRLMKREPRDIVEIQETVHPRDYRVFAGVIERHQWPLTSRLFFHAFGGRFGDNRDWPEIDAWAEDIAQTLTVCEDRSPTARVQAGPTSA